MALLLKGLREGGAHSPAPHDHNVHNAYPMLRITALTCTNTLLTSSFSSSRPHEGWLVGPTRGALDGRCPRQAHGTTVSATPRGPGPRTAEWPPGPGRPFLVANDSQ
ncbi:hypothetical protein GCM10018779_01170 [Streptomyces griseocarneus]|nr:hypothetical protein GCM10018779_01170 [Streptomyces griseocarneus]